MSRRGRHFVPFSLFSFQDIVTSVTAVIILITLIMVLELVNRSLDTAAPSAPVRSSSDHAEIRRIAADILSLEARLRHDAELLNDVAAGNPAELHRQITELEEQNRVLGRDHEILHRRSSDTAAQLKEAVAELQNEAASLEELDSLRQQAQQAREQVVTMKRENQLIYNAAPGSSKDSWLVDIAEGRLVVIQLLTGKEMRFDSGILNPAVSQFMQWTGALDGSGNHFVLLVRPSGIEEFTELRSRLTQAGFTIGFDLIGARQTVRAGKQSGPAR